MLRLTRDGLRARRRPRAVIAALVAGAAAAAATRARSSGAPSRDALWQLTLAALSLPGRAPAPTICSALRGMATLFLDRKEFSGAGGLVVGDEMAVAIAAQACLPVLELGLDRYDGFVGIVVHADAVVAPSARSPTRTASCTRYDEVLAGEAMEGGPVMLSLGATSQRRRRRRPSGATTS